MTFSLEQTREILKLLEEPFDPELVHWRAGPTNKEKTKAVALVYADPRAYSDRLNEVLTAAGWSDEYTINDTPFVKVKRGHNGQPDTTSGGQKLIVTCTVTVPCLDTSHSDVGECETDDENAATVAAAQAFKRACTKFGLGRYFYDFPRNIWVAYDDKSKQVTPPDLPSWAIPAKKCDDCHKAIEPFILKKGEESTEYTVASLIRSSQKNYKKNLCAPCQKQRKEKPVVDDGPVKRGDLA